MAFTKMGLRLRRLGQDDMREFLRIIVLPARDLMDENFANDLLKAMLSWDGLIGSKMAPRSPNHAVWVMLYRMSGELGGDPMVPAGGVAGLPEFSGLARPDGRMIIAPDMDTIEFAFDDAKYGEASEQPVLEMIIPSLHDPSLAPQGQHVLSAHVMYVPHNRKGGWNDEARDRLRAGVVDTIARYAPGIKKQIIHQQLLTPADIAKTCNVTGGHWHHTELALDQLMMRPTYEAAQTAMPIPGLYLASAGCHPGGRLDGRARP